MFVAPDVEELVCQYLNVNRGVANVSAEMMPNPPMPFHLITRVAGAEDGVCDHAVVSVHSFHTTRTGASTEARSIHGLMNFWGLSPQTPILVNGNYVSIDSVETVESPRWVYYSDEANFHRYVARYRISVRVNQTT